MASLKQFKRFFRRLSTGNDARSAEAQRRSTIAAGDAARNRGAWPEAVTHYALALALRPDDAALLVQYGHALKESGRISEAEGAYKAASVADATDTEGLMQLGHVRKAQQRADEALDSYAEALRRNPECKAARNELIAAGARDRLTMFNYGQSAVASTLAQIGTTLDHSLKAIEELLVVSTFPVEAYNAFRKTFPIQPPPLKQDMDCNPLAVWIDASEGSPAHLRRTLYSLIDQRDRNWQAYVFNAGKMRQQSVASIADLDSRVEFVENSVKNHTFMQELDTIINIASGTFLDPEAIGWLRYAARRSPNAAVYSDHDHYIVHWREGLTRFAPALQPAPDCYDLATTPAPPAIVLMSSIIFQGLVNEQGPLFSLRKALQFALTQGAPAIHIPRVLASVPAAVGESARTETIAPPMPPQSAGNARILVIIPTRDQANLLRICIQSLKKKSKRPELLNLVIVDNNSTDKETDSYLTDINSHEDIKVISDPTPFNWSRLNNKAAFSDHDSDILVFSNNDIEMLTSGWDDLLRLAVLEADAGVVGPRLVYPDGKLQHAGIAMGYENNRPHHEGAGAPASSGGPLDRWRRRRIAGALTGAFLAVRTDVFEAAEGFNENLAIGYNDIDFCFRVRQLGLKAIFEPSIEAIHHESITRGINNSPDKIEWDDAELEDLHAIWGQALFKDPSINPQWVSTQAHAFNGLRDLSLRQIISWMEYSANPSPRPRLKD